MFCHLSKLNYLSEKLNHSIYPNFPACAQALIMLSIATDLLIFTYHLYILSHTENALKFLNIFFFASSLMDVSVIFLYIE